MKLSTESVTVRLAGDAVVRDVNLVVGAGQMVGLVGPNGSGKTTLLRAAYRALRPTRGVIWLDDENLWRLDEREAAKRLAVLAQENPPEFEFSAWEVAETGRIPHRGTFGRGTADDDEVVAGALARAGVAHLADRNFHAMSGGERQRVLIARALAQAATVLILDEPTNHLDVRYQLEIMRLVRELGLTTLVALHDLNLSASSCDAVYLLSRGAVVAHGPPEVALEAGTVGRVFGVQAREYAHPITGCHQLAFTPLMADGGT